MTLACPCPQKSPERDELLALPIWMSVRVWNPFLPAIFI